MMHGEEIIIVCVHQIGSILLLVGGLKKEVQINKKANSATMFYVFGGGGYIKG